MLQMILFARIAILDPALFTIFPKKKRILIAFPICLIMYLFEEECHQNEVHLLPGRFGMNSEVWRSLLVEPCHSFSSRNYSTPQNGWKIPRHSSVKDVLLPFVWNKSVPILDSPEYHQSVPEKLASNTEIHWYPWNIRFSSCYCLCEGVGLANGGHTLLGRSAQVLCELQGEEVEGVRQEVREVKDEENGEINGEREPHASWAHVDGMNDGHSSDLSHAVQCAMWRYADTRWTRPGALKCSCWCALCGRQSWLSCRHWCRSCITYQYWILTFVLSV